MTTTLKKNFLVEIGTEELPPKSLRKLAEAFAVNFSLELKNANFFYDDIKWFATPRRLALKVENLNISQPESKIEQRSSNAIQAFDYSNSNKLSKDWARSCDININQVKRLTTSSEWLSYFTYIKSKHIESLIPSMVSNSLVKLPIDKLMRWGTGEVSFVRPIHTVTLLLGDQIISTTILGVKSNCIINGHRFMGEPEFTITNADQYPQILMRRGKVIADYEMRKAKIRNDAVAIANNIGGNVDLSDDLLEEVTSLVEWPVVLTAKFDNKFLSIPSEILVHILKKYQKYFPIYSLNDGKLLPNFIFVVNIESKNVKEIISGNERVIHARLVDANFLFKIDRKKHLLDYLPLLKNVFFQKKLGSLYDKTSRIQILAGWTAQQIGANVNYAIRASMLSKCDLMTQTVFEFPDIKGIIGMRYARYDSEPEDVAVAIDEHYKPRFANDELPSNQVACTVAIADKIDTLVGILGIGLHPKGDRDPFALKRTALGIIRIILENQLNLDLQVLIEKAINLYGNKLNNASLLDDVINFILDRFHIWCRQNKGYNTDAIQSVLSIRPLVIKTLHLADFEARIKAISYFRTLKIAENLISANKRISNILIKSNECLNEVVNFSLLKKKEEIILAEDLILMNEKLKYYLAKSYYQDLLIEYTNLCKSIDNFFKNVMVNTSDKDVRINRLTLLTKLQNLFLQVADISLLQ